MKRLFTFGCSFTQFNWPSWADLLGMDDFVFYSANWGCAGLGNRAIAERVAECNVRAKFTKDDVVIVQWSSHFRHDWMHTRMPIEDVSLWRTKGSIFSPPNQYVFDEKWIRTFWDEKAYYIHTLNSIALVQGLLDASGCKWYMTSLNDLSKIGNSVDQQSMYGDFHNPERQLFSVWDVEHSMMDYKTSLWDERQDHWLMPMIDFKNNHPDLDWYFPITKDRTNNLYEPVDGKFKEAHLTIDQHVLFLNTIKEKLGIPTSLNTAQEQLVKQINSIKQTSVDYDNFLNQIKETEWGRSLVHKGY